MSSTTAYGEIASETGLGIRRESHKPKANPRIAMGFSRNILKESEYVHLFRAHAQRQQADSQSKLKTTSANFTLSEVEWSRLMNFADAYDAVQNISTSTPNMAFSLRLNRFALLSLEELDALRKGFSPLVETDLVGDGRSLTTATSFLTRDLQSLPASVDWRSFLPVVKLQGQCGGCWSFAATGLLESHFAIRNSAPQGLVVSLSEQELLDCDREKNRACSGGNYYYTLRDYAYLAGVSRGRQHPYRYIKGDDSERSSDSTACYSSANSGQRAVLKATSRSDVTFVDRSELALMMALQDGPVAVAISGYNPLFQYYSSGIISDAEGCGTKIDHAALVVGYGEDERGTKFWLVRNSWGRDWGEDGYARLLRGSESVLSKTGGLGMCGILAQMNTLIRPPQCATDEDCNGIEDRDVEFCTTDYGCVNDTSFLSGGAAFNNDRGDKQSPLIPLFGSEQIGTIVIAAMCVLGFVSIMGIMVLIRLRRQRWTDPEIRVKNEAGPVGGSTSSSTTTLMDSPSRTPQHSNHQDKDENPGPSATGRSPSQSSFDVPAASESFSKSKSFASSPAKRKLVLRRDNAYIDDDESCVDEGLSDIESCPSASPSPTRRRAAPSSSYPFPDGDGEDSEYPESSGVFSPSFRVLSSSPSPVMSSPAGGALRRPGSPLKRLMFSLQHTEQSDSRGDLEDDEDADVVSEATV